MSRRRTEEAVAEAAPLGAAREAAGGRGAGAGSADPLAGELRRAGVLPLLVLHFLADGPSYGGALMERVETLSRGLIAVNPNTMYPLLRRLEGDGLIAREWGDPGGAAGGGAPPGRRRRPSPRPAGGGAAGRARLADVVGPRLDGVAQA